MWGHIRLSECGDSMAKTDKYCSSLWIPVILIAISSLSHSARTECPQKCNCRGKTYLNLNEKFEINFRSVSFLQQFDFQGFAKSILAQWRFYDWIFIKATAIEIEKQPTLQFICDFLCRVPKIANTWLITQWASDIGFYQCRCYIAIHHTSIFEFQQVGAGKILFL